MCASFLAMKGGSSASEEEEEVLGKESSGGRKPLLSIRLHGDEPPEETRDTWSEQG